MHWELIIKFLLLLGAANGAPVLARNLCKDKLSQPLDCGFRLPDGYRLFGETKTVRGLVVSLLATAATASFVGMPWSIGLAIALFSMLGDLTSSFIKRRFGMVSSSRWTGLDQLPEALFPALLGVYLLGLSGLDVVIIITLFFLGQIILSYLLYKVKFRRRPY